MQCNVKKRKRKKEKKEKKKKNELKHAYKSTKLVCDSSVMKISKNFSSNITYTTLSSNVTPKRQQVELPRHTKNTITCSHYNILHPANPSPENQFTLIIYMHKI